MQGDEHSVINQIPIARFKQNHISMMEGKLAKLDSKKHDEE